MDLNKINQKSLLEDKPTRRIAELEKDKKYHILKCILVKTRFGPAVLFEFNEFKAFLPKRLTEDYSAHTTELSSGKYSLIFRGTIDTGKTHPAISLEIVDK